MKNKILYILMLVAIILGAIVIVVKGFNYSIDFSKHQRIEIVLDNGFNISEMRKIVKESIKSKSIVRKSTLFGTSVVIDAKDISDEEISNLLGKINEKYGKDFELKDIKLPLIMDEMNISDVSSMSDDEINAKIEEIKDRYGLEYTSDELNSANEDVKISDIDKINLFDFIKPYIFSIILSLILILIYFGIRYHKLRKKAFIKEPLGLLIRIIVLQLFLVSIIGLCRIPMNNYVVDVMIIILMLQILVDTIKNEKRILDLKSRNN